MPWNECKPMDERLRFVARLLEGEKMAPVCREFGISPGSPATRSSSATGRAASMRCTIAAGPRTGRPTSCRACSICASMGQANLKGANTEQRVAALLTAHSAKLLTAERYNAFIAWTRSPAASVIGKELELFSTVDEQIIGVLFLDRTDRDFGYVVLGRDEKGRFRCVDVDTSMSRGDARHALLKALKKGFDSGVKVFPQGDEATDKAGLDLFTPIVPETKLSQTFTLLRSSAHSLPARSIISEMMRHFRDIDGNFVEQFQTSGFDARIWELYLYAALLELGLFVEKPEPAPDFLVSLGGRKVFIEAVTVNPSSGEPQPAPEARPNLRPHDEIVKLNDTKVPIKFGSALWSKLTRTKPYWEMKHVAGHPLVFAIADFHEHQSMTWTMPGLVKYLYGAGHDFYRDESGQLIISPITIETHEYDGKTIPSGFFLQPNSENVSAVLFSASGTIAKFDRMGQLAGFGHSQQRMFRFGVKHRHDNNSALPEPFQFEIKQGVVTETWAEGLSMFHNPNARYPVDDRLFPYIAHHHFDAGQIRSWIPDFHPYWSYTWNLLSEDSLENCSESASTIAEARD
jgi:hypothetical protein